MRLDWQTLITLAIGLVAALYLVRRWWPGLRNLLTPPATPPSASTCPSNQVASPAASCGSGCGNCGHQASPATKDHRVHVVRTRQG